MHAFFKCLICAALAGSILTSRCLAADSSDFYAGKRLTYIVGTAAGGGYDLYSRIFAEYFDRHIPGGPTIVVQNMPNASGVGAANFLYNLAPKDGTYFAMSQAGIVITEALTPTEVKYKSPQLGWVGTIATMTDVLGVLKSTGVLTLADAKKTPVLLGSTGKGSMLSMQPKLVNALLGTKFRVIGGYSGGSEVNIAMERGEVFGRTNQWDSWNSQLPDWIKAKRLSFLLQFGPKLKDLPGVPALRELVTDPADLALVDLLEIVQYVGRSVFTSPGVPQERMALLRRAFDETMKDPDYIARMKAAQLDLLPRSGKETQSYLAKVMSGITGTAQRFNQIIEAN